MESLLEPENLNKLKDFIDFLSADPVFLNIPQLKFVKDFIEKLGGKVPPLAFKMPPGNQFADYIEDVKSESKEPETESESEEVESEPKSEVDLDMDVAYSDEIESRHLNLYNAVYLQETQDYTTKHKRKKVSDYNKNIRENYEIHSEDEACTIGYDLSNEFDPIGICPEECIISKNRIDIDTNMEYSHEDNDPKVKMKCRTRKSNRRISDEGKSGSVISKQRQPKPVNCPQNCKHKCKERIDQKQRIAICTEFWNLDYVERKNFLLSFVETRHIGRIRTQKTIRVTKGYTNRYFVKNSDGEKVRVCLNFFLTTFSISNGVIKNAMQNRGYNGRYMCSDKRGKLKLENNQTSTIVENEIELNGSDAIGMQTFCDDNKDRLEVSSKSKSVDENNSSQEKTHKKFGWNKGKILKKDRIPQPINCDESCQMKCTKHFNEQHRAQICQIFWTMDYKRRKDFILSRIETREVSSMMVKELRKSDRAQRTFSNRYFFKSSRGNNIRVCAKFFMATLCIGRHVINNALQNADRQTGSYAGEDRRGKHTPKNKISDKMLDEVKQHIESYPTWVPHKGYKTRFLHSSLSIQKMWREYKQSCENQQRKYVSTAYFSNVFHKNYRLAFLKPTSKHAHKVSALKKDTSNLEQNKKININVSEFTGEEGGFWTTPSMEGKDVDAKQNLNPNLKPLSLAKNEALLIQENVKLLGPQDNSALRFDNTKEVSVNYANAHHGLSNVNIENYSDSNHEQQQSAVFNML